MSTLEEREALCRRFLEADPDHNSVHRPQCRVPFVKYGYCSACRRAQAATAVAEALLADLTEAVQRMLAEYDPGPDAALPFAVVVAREALGGAGE